MGILPLAVLAPALMTLARPVPLPPPVPPQHPPEPCAAAEHRQFDFWIGEWDWFDTRLAGPENGSMYGVTKVEKMNNGCVLVASYSPWSLARSTVVTHYDRQVRRWWMVWLGADGGREDYEGEFSNGKLVMTGVPRAGAALLRMTWFRGSEGSVRHMGEKSSDGGKTWSPIFDYTYWPRR